MVCAFDFSGMIRMKADVHGNVRVRRVMEVKRCTEARVTLRTSPVERH